MLPELRVVVGATQVSVSLHALAIVVGVAAGALLAARRHDDPALALATIAVVGVAALVGARALFALLHGGGGFWTGGLASIGGIAAGLAAAWMVARIAHASAAALLDVIVPAGLLALAIGRIGCFLGGCCYGSPTPLPWGVVFPEVGPPARHPLQLYSAVADIALLGVLRARAASAGDVACRGLVGFGLLRSGLELLRDAGTTDMLAPGWLTLPQAAALGLAVAAAFAARRLRAQGPSTMPPARRTFRAWPTRKR